LQQYNREPALKRKIISIDKEKCNGCGLCVPDCPEGALQIIDGKARLVGDLLCDGLGACLNKCPEGAISVEERDAEPYDEFRVMANVVPQGRNVIQAHLKHLREHNQSLYLQQALAYLRERGIEMDPPRLTTLTEAHRPNGCPGSQAMAFAPAGDSVESGARRSQLTHWPVQLHLLSPSAPQYRNSDLLLAADCVPFALADFHKDHLRGKTLAIACPKLDQGQEAYIAKLAALIDEAEVRSVKVMIMQVPCCSGLLRLATEAMAQANRKIPITCTVVSIRGEILADRTM
jgi:NAD-dependent dihydropyrimidine dehydrogenase PreA subunit